MNDAGKSEGGMGIHCRSGLQSGNWLQEFA
jgi:hypothetical protein